MARSAASPSGPWKPRSGGAAPGVNVKNVCICGLS
jgi:hypothetical protein